MNRNPHTSLRAEATGPALLSLAGLTAVGLVLFAITLALNIVALMTVRKYREQYD